MLTLLITLLLGCPAEALTCADQLPDDCEAAGCAVIAGRLLQETDDGAHCVDFTGERVPQGCMEAELGCGDAETLAAPPDDPDACWWFSSTCLPPGWVTCGEGWADACPTR
ncbi:MAG: hypothetical protein JXX28_19345 [Deltaproteobacteria bacterium]|nr:hypothetical protein [Deltaproteobacteria bacterium]